jgi:hypothetical protein
MRCLFCGCTDAAACPGGCSWALEDRRGKVGVCSSCSGIRATGGVGDRFDAAVFLSLGPIDLTLSESNARRLLVALRRALPQTSARRRRR